MKRFLCRAAILTILFLGIGAVLFGRRELHQADDADNGTAAISDGDLSAPNGAGDVQQILAPSMIHLELGAPVVGGNRVEGGRSSIGELFESLTTVDDTVEKRAIREAMSDLKPTLGTLTFLLEKLRSSTNAALNEQIYSVITLIDGRDAVPDIVQLASRTADGELFLSLAFSLRSAGTEESRKALFELLVDNQIRLVNVVGNPFKEEGMAGLYRALMDTMKPEDLSWVAEYSNTHNLSDAQRFVVQEVEKKH